MDAETDTLAGLASEMLEAEPANLAWDLEWELSPFNWIRTEPSASTRGRLGAALVSRWCAAEGFPATPAPTAHADRVVKGHRVEIKLSTLWEQGVYAFQQFRDQDFDVAFCLGLSPLVAHGWLIPKPVLLEHVIGHEGQHTGKSAADTFWLKFDPTQPPEWLAAYGGGLAVVRTLLQQLPQGPF